MKEKNVMWTDEQTVEIIRAMKERNIAFIDTTPTFDAIILDIERLSRLEPKGVAERVIKFNEEFGEFNAEIIKMLGLTYKPYSQEHMIEEAADALQVLLSVILTVCKEKDIQLCEILDAMQVKNKKWESKIKDYTINETLCTNND